jgi:hypothetical protein
MASDCKQIKVCTETHGKMLRVLGEIQQTTDERVTMEKAIVKLIEYWNNGGGGK